MGLCIIMCQRVNTSESYIFYFGIFICGATLRLVFCDGSGELLIMHSSTFLSNSKVLLYSLRWQIEHVFRKAGECTVRDLALQGTMG